MAGLHSFFVSTVPTLRSFGQLRRAPAEWCSRHLASGSRYGAWSAARKSAALMTVFVVTLNAAHAQERITIAALGDSLTQGYGLPPEEGFVAQLQKWLLEQEAGVKLINAGVSGDTTAGGLARVDWTLTPEVDAVIVALGGNDLLRGLDPANSRENLDGIVRQITERGLPVLLAGMRAPTNFGPDYKAEFDRIYPDLAAKYDVLLYPFFLEGLGAGENAAAARDLMQSDGLHPNAEGVSRMVADIGPSVLELAAAVRAEN